MQFFVLFFKAALDVMQRPRFWPVVFLRHIIWCMSIAWWHPHASIVTAPQYTDYEDVMIECMVHPQWMTGNGWCRWQRTVNKMQIYVSLSHPSTTEPVTPQKRSICLGDTCPLYSAALASCPVGMFHWSCFAQCMWSVFYFWGVWSFIWGVVRCLNIDGS